MKASPLEVTRLLALSLVLAGAGVVGLGGAALAQGAIIPVPLADEDGEEDADIVARLTAERFAAERARGTQRDPGAEPAQFISPLRPLHARGSAAGSAMRFDGETRDLEFMLFIPDPDHVQGLRIATRSSINVLPERSRFRVYLNEAYVGTGRLENVTGFGALDLTVDPAMLRQGENRVRIELVQHHRIFCGPDASFALWSDVDLAASGALLDGPPADGGEAAFLLGVAAAAASGGGVEIAGIAGLGEQAEQWVAHVTEHISEALGGDPVPFRFTGHWRVQQEAPSAARVTFLPAAQQRVQFRMAGDGAQVMVIRFRPGEPLQPLPEFETRIAGTARPSQTLIDGQRPMPLSALGFRSVEVFNRYQRIEQRFRLPDDFVILTNAKAELRLDYAYAAELPRGAMLLVHVNDTNVRLLPLRGQPNQMIEDFPIRFEARLLHAGTNTLGFEAIIPGDPPDLPCPTWEDAALALGAGSTLSVPYSPSMFLPDMHFAFVNLHPRSVTANEMTARAFPPDDIATLRAALVSGGRERRESLATRLHLLSIDDLGSVPTGGYPFSRNAIEAVLVNQPAAGLYADAGGAGGAGGTGSAGGSARQAGLLDLSPQREAETGVSAGWAWLTRQASIALQWLHPRPGMMLEHWLREQRGQAILLQLDTSRPQHIWMLRAPGSDISAVAGAIAAARERGDGPRGQVSVLDRDGQWQNWYAPDRQPTLLEPITLGNMRHVLGNFVSAMPVRYVIGLFFLALLSALVALRLVIATREH